MPCCSPASRERRAGLAHALRPAPLIATRRGPPPARRRRRCCRPPGCGAAGLGVRLHSPRAPLLHTCSRAPRPALRPERAGGAAAQVRRQLRGPPAGRQVDRAARGRELSGARRPDCAASGLPCAGPRPPHPRQQAGGQAQYFSSPAARITLILANLPWLGGGRAGEERAERRRAGTSCLWPLGALCGLKAAAEKWNRTGGRTGERSHRTVTHSHQDAYLRGLNTRFNSRLFLNIFLAGC